MTTESQAQGWAAAFGAGLTPRDFFAMAASEADIQAHMRHEVTSTMTDLHGSERKVVSVIVRTREQARYAFADAMMAERGKV